MMGLPFLEMKRVIVESPYRGTKRTSASGEVTYDKDERDRNKRYLEHCLRDCIYRRESPYASHKLLTTCLDDDDPQERHLGISAGLAWHSVAMPVFYVDLGWSAGMELARDLYDREALKYEKRNLPKDNPFWAEQDKFPGGLGPATRRFLLGDPGVGVGGRLGPATIMFLLDTIQERIDELIVAEKDLQLHSKRSLYLTEDEFSSRMNLIKGRIGTLLEAVEELRRC